MSAEIETLHRPFERFLRDNFIPFVRARSDRESTIAEGHPDFTLLVRNSSLMIEFKTKEGKLSREQRGRIKELEIAGNTVHVVRELNAAIELAFAWRSTLKEPPTFQSNGRIIHRIGSALYEEKDGQLNRISV